jgi:hypothetical protein
MMKHQLKYSRRTLMKALGVGAGLLPLIRTRKTLPPATSTVISRSRGAAARTK